MNSDEPVTEYLFAAFIPPGTALRVRIESRSKKEKVLAIKIAPAGEAA